MGMDIESVEYIVVRLNADQRIIRVAEMENQKRNERPGNSRKLIDLGIDFDLFADFSISIAMNSRIGVGMDGLRFGG